MTTSIIHDGTHPTYYELHIRHHTNRISNNVTREKWTLPVYKVWNRNKYMLTESPSIFSSGNHYFIYVEHKCMLFIVECDDANLFTPGDYGLTLVSENMSREQILAAPGVKEEKLGHDIWR